MPATTEPCPECGADARQIKTQTVRNMVEPFGNQDIEDDVQYRICGRCTRRYRPIFQFY